MLSRLKARLAPTADPVGAQVLRLQRRKRGIRILQQSLPILRVLLFLIGYGWMLLFPTGLIGRGTYIDENALQPAQVKTHWSWEDVTAADRYLAHLEGLRDRNASSRETADFIKQEFINLGLPAATQSYSFETSTGVSNGTNAYAILASPRTSGTEAIVISASRISRMNEGNGSPNLRGIATVLALAGFTKKYSHWAKDLVFVINDGYLDGMQAWLNSYHGFSQSNMDAERLDIISGVIWTALCIDYPGHSFSHLGLFVEGVNGRLPNQDLVNSANQIARYTAQIPLLLYDHLDYYRDHYDMAWAPDFVKQLVNHIKVKDYEWRGKSILRHIQYQTQGKPSGVHGLFHQFRIDALTLFAYPSMHPHGFYSLGHAIESTMRTMNNLLERLHASLFFYIFTTPHEFLKIGHYLPTTIIVSLGISFGGLGLWVWTGWELIAVDEKSRGWRRRQRPVLSVVGIIIWTHILGGILYLMVTARWFSEYLQAKSPAIPIIASAVPTILSLLPIFVTHRRTRPATAPLSLLLKSLNLILAGMFIAITSVLNFSLALTLSILLGIPLSLSSPSRTPLNGLGGFFTLICLLSPTGLAVGMSHWLGSDEVMAWVVQAVRDWQVVGSWFVPFICAIYTPLVWQSALVCLLPP